MLPARRKKRKKRRPFRSLVKINLKDKNPREAQRMRKDVVMNVECVTRIVLIEHCTNQEQLLGELTHDQTQETLHQKKIKAKM